jgi:hypothetical protein
MPGPLKGDEDDDDNAGNRTSSTNNDNDSDFDNDSPAMQNKGYRDGDDRAFVTWGSPARAGDVRAVTSLVKRYYAAAAADNGAQACLLIYTLFAEAIPEDYGQPPGPVALRGSTCAVVLTKLFSQQHARVAAENASLEVTGVRVMGGQGRALLGFTSSPAAFLQLHRERDRWMVGGIIGNPLP